MKTCENNKIYIPWLDKCMYENTGKAKELKKLIIICEEFQDYDLKCTDINKIYKTTFSKVKKLLNKSLTPIISVSIFNLFIFLSLTNKTVRRKLLRFTLNNINMTAPYAFILEPFIMIIPTILNFLDRYGNIFRLAVNGPNLNTLLGLIHHFILLVYYNPYNIFQNADILAENIQNIPGEWINDIPVPIDVPVQNIRDVENNMMNMMNIMNINLLEFFTLFFFNLNIFR